jgi:hypothetical protein
MTKRGWWGSRRVRLVLTATALAVVAASGPEPAGAVSGPGITVHPAGASNTLVVFRSASCRVSAGAFNAYSSAGGYRLWVKIPKFTGFHTYTLRWEGYPGPRFSVLPPGQHVAYTNYFVPNFTVPPAGGAITFPRGRGAFGLGFINAANSVEWTNAIALAGYAVCHYPPVRR